MAGRGAPPKPDRVRRAKPVHDWQPTVSTGWQHDTSPKCPSGLMPESRKAWATWMGAWFAAHWSPEDLPGLRQLIRLYDQVERGEFQRHGELRIGMDTYGITPKGQQDRRWQRPTGEVEKVAERSTAAPYGHLRSVDAG